LHKRARQEVLHDIPPTGCNLYRGRTSNHNDDIKIKEIVKMGFADLMASSAGRIARIAVGLILIAVGLWIVGGFVGIILAIVGLLPLLASLLDVCLIGALFLGTPLRGVDIRTKSKE
jgi:hypothetical protein